MTVSYTHLDVYKRQVYCCELMFDAVMRHADTEKTYTPLPKYPSTSRDIALLVDEDMAVGRIEEIIKKYGKSILEDVRLFDVYRGKQVEEGKKSVAFNLIYRDKDKTLTDEEVTSVHGKEMCKRDREYGISFLTI